jgi:predicted RNA-binding Zn ribbon-like protein
MVNTTLATAVMTQWNHKDHEQFFEQGILFRKTLRDIAERIVARKAIPGSAVTSINQLLSRCPGYPQLVYAKGRFERQFQSLATLTGSLLAPLAEAASNLLCSGNLSLVKKCGNAACILSFYDTTKNHTRHWCRMQLCGNRMKVAAHYHRKRDNPKQ